MGGLKPTTEMLLKAHIAKQCASRILWAEAKKKAEATGVRIEGFTASELADVESALTWISQNKESPNAEPAA